LTVINWTNSQRKEIKFIPEKGNAAYTGLSAPASGRFTPDFIAAATANFRCPKAMVEVTWASGDLDEGVVISSNDVNRIDRTGQVTNGVTESGRKWAYIHDDLKPDGTFFACPELDSEPEMGWYGKDLVCDGSGDFSPIDPPWIQIAHDARSYTAVTVSGDSGYNEYPVDFTISLTNSSGTTDIVVTGNTERVYTKTFTPVADVTVMGITISKWSAPDTIVKLVEVSGSLIDVYRADDILSLQVLEETNSDTGAVPIGNVSANELDLSLANTERRFSYGNTASVYNSSLKSGRKIRLWLGFILPPGSSDVTGQVPGYIVETIAGEKIGYMPYGIYWSKDWYTSYESQEARTTAYDIVYSLIQKEFIKSANYTDTVENIVDDILEEARLEYPDLTWQVSSDTASLVLDNIAFEPKNYLEILKDIAEATQSFTYVDRDGVLQVGRFLEAATPLESYAQLDLSNYFNFKSDPKVDELVNRVRVGYTTYEIKTDIYSNDREFEIPAGGSTEVDIDWNVDGVYTGTVVITLTDVTGVSTISSSEVFNSGAKVTVTGSVGNKFTLAATGTPRPTIYSDDETFIVPAAGSIQLYINFDPAPVQTSSVEILLERVTGFAEILESEVYAYGALVTVVGTAGWTFKLSARGTNYTLTENTETEAENADSIRLYGLREFSLTGNQQINTIARAEAIAAQLILFYGSLRQDAAINWPASTLLAVGDTLEVVEFKSDVVETKDFFIIKRQTTSYDGGLVADAELRRG